MTAAESDEVRLMCPHCYGVMYVKLAWPFTPERKQQAMHDAVEDHRRQCAKAPPEAKRVYRIDYPRA